MPTWMMSPASAPYRPDRTFTRQACAVIEFRVISNRFPTCYSRIVGGIKNPGNVSISGVMLVAGVGFEPTTFRL